MALAERVKVASLWTYPVTGLPGVRVSAVQLTQRGLLTDHLFILVRADDVYPAQPVTELDGPAGEALATIEPLLDGGAVVHSQLKLTAPGMTTVVLPLDTAAYRSGPPILVAFGDDTLEGRPSIEGSKWVSRCVATHAPSTPVRESSSSGSVAASSASAAHVEESFLLLRVMQSSAAFTSSSSSPSASSSPLSATYARSTRQPMLRRSHATHAAAVPSSGLRASRVAAKPAAPPPPPSLSQHYAEQLPPAMLPPPAVTGTVEASFSPAASPLPSPIASPLSSPMASPVNSPAMRCANATRVPPPQQHGGDATIGGGGAGAPSELPSSPPSSAATPPTSPSAAAAAGMTIVPPTEDGESWSLGGCSTSPPGRSPPWRLATGLAAQRLPFTIFNPASPPAASVREAWLRALAPSRWLPALAPTRHHRCNCVLEGAESGEERTWAEVVLSDSSSANRSAGTPSRAEPRQSQEPLVRSGRAIALRRLRLRGLEPGVQAYYAPHGQAGGMLREGDVVCVLRKCKSGESSGSGGGSAPGPRTRQLAAWLGVPAENLSLDVRSFVCFLVLPPVLIGVAVGLAALVVDEEQG